jgi:hypothetical protein
VVRYDDVYVAVCECGDALREELRELARSAGL